MTTPNQMKNFKVTLQLTDDGDKITKVAITNSEEIIELKQKYDIDALNILYNKLLEQTTMTRKEEIDNRITELYSICRKLQLDIRKIEIKKLECDIEIEELHMELEKIYRETNPENDSELKTGDYTA